MKLSSIAPICLSLLLPCVLEPENLPLNWEWGDPRTLV